MGKRTFWHERPTKTQIRIRCLQENKLCFFRYPKCAQSRFWSDSANVQADLNLRWAHMSEGTFLPLLDDSVCTVKTFATTQIFSNQSTDSTCGSIVPEWETGKIVLRRLTWLCYICPCPSPSFIDNPLYTTLWHHSDKNSAAMNNCYLDFPQTRGLISLVNDTHVVKQLIWKYCGKEEKLLLRSNFSSFPQYFVTCC